MKFKIRELHEMFDSLKELSTKDLPCLTAYKLSKFIRSVDSELKIEGQARVKTLESYGAELDKKTNLFNLQVVKDRSEDEFNALVQELETLSNHEVDIEFEAIPLSSLGSIDLKPIILFNLNSIIMEKEIKR